MKNLVFPGKTHHILFFLWRCVLLKALYLFMLAYIFMMQFGEYRRKSPPLTFPTLLQDDFTSEDFVSMSAPLLYKMFKSKSDFPLHAAVRLKREDVVFLYLIEHSQEVSKDRLNIVNITAYTVPTLVPPDVASALASLVSFLFPPSSSTISP